MIPAYLIGGPMDCKKIQVLRGMTEVLIPQNPEPAVVVNDTLQVPKPSPVVCHRYRSIRHELMDQFTLYHYEGTW